MSFTPKETIIYGGAFNPPTLAHQAILQACAQYAEPRGADVWLLPSGNRADKTIATEYGRRYELCEALIQDVQSRGVMVEVNCFELDNSELTQTYETVMALQAAYPDRHFTWVFGSDSVASMPEWSHGGWLKENLSMLVADRPGVPEITLGANARWLGVSSPISSTEVRRRMAAGEAYDELVGKHVGALLKRAVVF